METFGMDVFQTLPPHDQMPPLIHSNEFLPGEFFYRARTLKPSTPLVRFRERVPNANLAEYLRSYHDYVTNNPEGPVPAPPFHEPATGPKDDTCLPTKVRPWTGFIEDQKAALDKLFNVFHQEARVFENGFHAYSVGTFAAAAPPERDVHVVGRQHHGAVAPIERIINKLREMDLDELRPEHEIMPIAVKIGGPGAVPRGGQKKYYGPEQRYICYTNTTAAEGVRDGKGYLTVYKSPLKAPISLLRQGLEGIANQAQDADSAGPNDPRAAAGVALAAIEEVYRGMVQAKLEFGCFITGDAYVFLRIDWEDGPGVVYYYLAEPREDVDAHPEDPVLYTGISQLLALTVRALKMV